MRRGDRRCWCIYCNGRWRPRQTHHDHLANPQNLIAKEKHDNERPREGSEPESREETSSEASPEDTGRVVEESPGSGHTGRDSRNARGGEEDSLPDLNMPPPSPPSTEHGSPAELPSQPASSLEDEEGADDQQSHSTDRHSYASSLDSLEEQSGQVDDQDFSGDESASAPESSEGSVNCGGMEMEPCVEEIWSAPGDVPLDLTGLNPLEYATICTPGILSFQNAGALNVSTGCNLKRDDWGDGVGEEGGGVGRFKLMSGKQFGQLEGFCFKFAITCHCTLFNF